MNFNPCSRQRDTPVQKLKLIPTPFVCALAFVASTGAAAQAPNVVTHETVTIATVEQIDQSARTATFRINENTTQSMVVDASVKEFDRLKRGDRVTVRWVESTVVQVRRDAKLAELRDSTNEARKTDPTVVQQLTAIVTVEDVDPQKLFITFRTADDQKMTRPVPDKKLVEGLRHGDRIEVTMTRARAISIQPAR